jgi:hypothetical protein
MWRCSASMLSTWVPPWLVIASVASDALTPLAVRTRIVVVGVAAGDVGSAGVELDDVVVVLLPSSASAALARPPGDAAITNPTRAADP